MRNAEGSRAIRGIIRAPDFLRIAQTKRNRLRTAIGMNNSPIAFMYQALAGLTIIEA